MVDNHVAHNKMKHIELHFHYLRQLVHENIVTLFYCISDDQIGDIFTKPLLEAKFLKFYLLLRLQEVVIRGCVLTYIHLLNLKSVVLMGCVGT